MARLKSIEEYDFHVAEKKSRIAAQAESKLEAMIKKHTGRVTKKASKLADRAENMAYRMGVTAHVVDLVVDADGLLEECRERCDRMRQELFPAILDEVKKDYFSSCFKDLVSCCVALKGKQADLCLDEDQKNEAFARIVMLFNELAEYDPSLSEEVPEIYSVTRYFFLPHEEKQVATFRNALTGVGRKGFIDKERVEALLDIFYRVPEVRAVQTDIIKVPAVRPPEPAENTDTSRERIDFLLSIGMTLDLANRYESIRSLDSFISAFKGLEDIVGDDAKVLLRVNPDIMAYGNGGLLKYLHTLHEVVGKVRADSSRKPWLLKRYGIDSHPEMYASLDAVMGLRQKLSAQTFVGRNEMDHAEFDIDGYKRLLIVKTALNVELVTAFVYSKNLLYCGEYYMPIENFRKNTSCKISDQSLMSGFDALFDRMVKLGVIVRKHKDNPVYRFNPNINGIKDDYLKEYMRLALHSDQIVKQEGRLTFNEDIVEELYPSKRSV